LRKGQVLGLEHPIGPACEHVGCAEQIQERCLLWTSSSPDFS
jgi:hypothetical protein